VSDQPPSSAASETYTERLYTPWWWYVAALIIAALLGAEFATAFSAGWLAWVPFFLLIIICVVAVWRFSSGRVRVTATDVQAGDRVVALARIDRAISLSPTELRLLVGRHGDPAAFDFIRSWVGPGIQLVLRPDGGGASGANDPAESTPSRQSSPTTPYWVVSTRHPERMLAALAAASVRVH
jgi:hypothetical protein